jgi:hypothetical protein
MRTTQTRWMLGVLWSASLVGLSGCGSSTTAKQDGPGGSTGDGGGTRLDVSILDPLQGGGTTGAGGARGSGGALGYDGAPGAGGLVGTGGSGTSGGRGGVSGIDAPLAGAGGMRQTGGASGLGGGSTVRGSGGGGGSGGKGGTVGTGGMGGADAPIVTNPDGSDASSLILGMIEMCPGGEVGPAGSSCLGSATPYCKRTTADTCWCDSSKKWVCPKALCPDVGPREGDDCATPSSSSGLACIYNAETIVYCGDNGRYGYMSVSTGYTHIADGGVDAAVDGGQDATKTPPPFTAIVGECRSYSGGEPCSPPAEFVGILACWHLSGSGIGACACQDGHWVCPPSDKCPSVVFPSGSNCEKAGSMCINPDGQFCICVYYPPQGRLLFSCFSNGVPAAYTAISP